MVIICLILLIIAAANAQEMPNEKIRHYIKDNVIYWHKELPYYLYISSSPDSVPTLMESNGSYANPAFFDTKGNNYIRTKWAMERPGVKVTPEQEILWPIYVDDDPPITTAQFSSSGEYLHNGVRYFTKDLMCEFKSMDAASGVRSTYYSLNDSVYIKYDSPVALNPKDTFHIKYFSVDNVGNREKVRTFKYAADDYSIQYAVDAYAPETKISTDFHKNRFVGPNMPIAFESRDKGSGVAITYYKLDGGDFIPYVGPFFIDPDKVAGGVHKLSWYSVDYITNKEEIKTKNFYFDTTEPTVYISAGGSYFSKDSIMFITDSTKIRLSAYDGMGIKKIAYKFNTDDHYLLYDHTKPLILPNGTNLQNLKYFATDSVDNDSKIHVIKLQRDISKPELKLSILGDSFTRHDTTFVAGNGILNISAKDLLSGIGKNVLYVNGQQVKSSNFDVDGVYHVIDTLYDNIGNYTTASKIYRKDSKSPEIEFIFSNPPIADGINDYPVGTVLFFTITDSVGLYQFKIVVNGIDIKGSTFSGKVGRHKATIKALDLLKQGSEKTIEFSIVD